MSSFCWTRPLQSRHPILRRSYHAKHQARAPLFTSQYLTRWTKNKQPHIPRRPLFPAHRSSTPTPRLLSSSSTLHQVHSHEESLRDSLRHFKHDKWGWVIYRCTYGDDEAWARFQKIFTERSRKRLAKPSVPPEVANGVEWTFVSDQATLDGASRDELRHRFRAWAAEAEKREQPRAEKFGDRFDRAQRYTYFIQVDEEGLRTVAESDPSDLLDAGWVNIVRADESMDFGRKIKKEEDGYIEEPEDEGWMMIASFMVDLDFYDVLGGSDSWYAVYTPPPGLVVY